MRGFSFSIILRKYRNGTLKNVDKKRVRDRKYKSVEVTLVEYIYKLRQARYRQDKIGISWALLTEKCKNWAEEMNLIDFKCSAGWLNNTLKSHGFEQINLHGKEEDDLKQ